MNQSKLQLLQIAFVSSTLILTTACATTTGSSNSQGMGGQGQPPSASEIISQLDTNGDGYIAQSEAKGPLAQHFSQIDSNGDGYLSQSELENIPKPQGGQRSQR